MFRAAPGALWHVLGWLWLLCCAAPALAAQSLSFSLGAAFVAIEPLALDPPDRQWLDQRRILRVGTAIADNEPIDITSDRNRYQGISADYLGLVSRRLGIEVQVVGFTQREEAVQALRNGRIDLLTSAGSFERRLPGLAFSRPYLSDRALVVGRGDEAVPAQGLAGKKIVLLDDYADPQVVQQAYPDSEIILAPNLYSAMEALGNKAADVLIGNDIVVRSWLAMRRYLGLQVLFESNLPGAGLMLAMRADEVRLHALIDQALSSLEPALTGEVLARWSAGLQSGSAGQRITLNSAERHWLTRHAQVTVAATQHPPYLYRDADGRWVGLNADILARISRMTGLQFIFRETPSTQASIDVLRHGQAAMSTTLAENAERRQFLDFTYSFGGNHWVFVVPEAADSPASLTELGARVLALPARHALEDEIRQGYPDIRLHLVDTYAQARELVASGQADVTLQNEASVWLYPDRRLKAGRSVDGKWSPDRFSVIRSQPELLGILNKALEEFPVAEMRTIRMKWLDPSTRSPAPWRRVGAWLAWGLPAVLLVLAGLFVQRCFRGQVRRRQQAEARLREHLAFSQVLLDSLPVPVHVHDLQGRLLSCNRNYADSLGISAEHLLGRRLAEISLLARPLAEQMQVDHRQLLSEGRPVFGERVLELSGKRIEAWQWSVPFFTDQGQMQGSLGGWLDISERKALQAQLAQVMGTRSALVSSLQHEVRLPIETLLGLLEQACRGRESGEGEQQACRAMREVMVRFDTLLGKARF